MPVKTKVRPPIVGWQLTKKGYQVLLVTTLYIGYSDWPPSWGLRSLEAARPLHPMGPVLGTLALKTLVGQGLIVQDTCKAPTAN